MEKRVRHMTETTRLLREWIEELNILTARVDMVDLPGHGERKREILFHIEAARDLLQHITE